jgi:hypothetical protein
MPYFFETHYKGERPPQYRRFLGLERDRLIELTWLTGAAGLSDEESKHRKAWVEVLAHLDKQMANAQ